MRFFGDGCGDGVGKRRNGLRRGRSSCDGVGTVVKCMGMGRGQEKFHGDDVGIGPVSTAVSLFTIYP